MTNAFKVIALLCLLALLAGAALVITSNFGLAGAIGLAIAAIAGWLVATWYFRDNEPLFGPATPNRVTFKQVVVDALHDAAALTKPIWMRLWLNIPFAAVVAANGVVLMDDQMRAAVFGDFWGGIVMVGAALLIRYGSTPAHPPVATR